NVAAYLTFQNYFRTHKPRFLAAWGKNDPFFLPAGAEAFKRDIPDAMVHFFDTGHFALEPHAKEIAAIIRDFFARSTCDQAQTNQRARARPENNRVLLTFFTVLSTSFFRQVATRSPNRASKFCATKCKSGASAEVSLGDAMANNRFC